MGFDELKEKALGLPLTPGVYIMRDKSDKVIYVGKAKKLKNRVSQYFQDTASHTVKTRLMVSNIHNFDVIVAASEFEALVLECSLIKRYMPKYNILLKDDKGYPYIRLDVSAQYPKFSMVSKIADDGAAYFGPFGSRGTTTAILDAIHLTLKLPNCKKSFPRDIGKDRPCLNYHMNQCDGWCQLGRNHKDYCQRIDQARQLLSGNYKKVAQEIRDQMLAAAENMEFELAASLRDRLAAVEALSKKQLVTAGNMADMDVIGYGQTESKSCFAVLHYRGGNLLDKDYEVFPTADDPESAVSSLMKQYYLNRGVAPKVVLLPFKVDDSDLFAQLIEQQYNKKIQLRVPQRGNNMRLVELANKNAAEEAQRLTSKEERTSATLQLLGKMLAMDPPKRIESFDISNISGTDMVASMVVFEDGKPRKSDYRKFKINDLTEQDDYAAMRQVICRRFLHLKAGDKGFEKKPDLVLIDGGVAHAAVAANVLKELDLHIRTLGMVKDERHRTRALVTPDGQVIHIDSQQSIFSLIGNIQEETHNFAISYHKKLRSKRLRRSALDNIPGVGPKRKEELLKAFGSISAIAEANVLELERLLPKKTALEVYRHFHPDTEYLGENNESN